MKNEEKTIVEINGVKLEVDLRTAKRIDTFQIGSKIKVLKKEYEQSKVYHGVIVGFDNFKELPTIIICYLKFGYKEASVEFAYINSSSEGIEIVPSMDDDSLVDKALVVEALEKEKLSLQDQITEIERKKQYFLKHFELYFDAESNEKVL